MLCNLSKHNTTYTIQIQTLTGMPTARENSSSVLSWSVTKHPQSKLKPVGDIDLAKYVATSTAKSVAILRAIFTAIRVNIRSCLMGYSAWTLPRRKLGRRQAAAPSLGTCA